MTICRRGEVTILRRDLMAAAGYAAIACGRAFFQFHGSSSSSRERMGGDAREDVGEPGLRIDAVHLRRHDQAIHGRGASAAIGAGEEPVLPSEGNRPFILPVLGAKSKFITVGTRFMDGGSLCITARCEPALV